MEPSRVRALTFASFAALLPSFDLRAQGNSAAAAEAAVTDFAAAERALADAPKLPKSPAGAAVRTAVRSSPDGTQRAWIVGYPGVLASAPSKPDAIELIVEDVASGKRSTTRFECADFNHDRRRGPVWSADGGVLVAYDVQGKETAYKACADLVRNGEARPFLREEDWSVRSVAASAAGTVAIALQHAWNGSSAVLVCGADGESRVVIDPGKSRCVSAAPSPDGRQIALLLDDQVAVAPATGGEPRKLAALDHADNYVTADRDVPTWLADGKSFVVAAGGDVVHVDVSNGELHRWNAAALGGTAADVVVLPGDAIAAAIALHETDANLADVVMHAGCASKSRYLDLVWLDLKSGKSQGSSIADKWVVGDWADMPKVGSLVARFGH
jgi:hypothetical protein